MKGRWAEKARALEEGREFEEVFASPDEFAEFAREKGWEAELRAGRRPEKRG